MAKNAPSVTSKNAPKPKGVGGTVKGGKNNRTTHSPHATNATVDQGAKNFKMSTAGQGSFATSMIDEYNKKGAGQGKAAKTIAKRPMGC